MPQFRGFIPGVPFPGESPSSAAALSVPQGRGGPTNVGAVLSPGPLVPVPCPRGQQWCLIRLCLHVSEWDVGRGPGRSVLRRLPGPRKPLPTGTRVAPRPGRTRLVVSFFSDRNGVIVGDGKLRRVPTMGTQSCGAV